MAFRKNHVRDTCITQFACTFGASIFYQEDSAMSYSDSGLDIDITPAISTDGAMLIFFVVLPLAWVAVTVLLKRWDNRRHDEHWRNPPRL